MTALVWVATSIAALAQSQPNAARHPFQGDWSLEFRVATRPGGETRVASRGLPKEDVATVNLLAQMSRPSFTVAADGILRWEQREGGQVH